MRSGICYPSRTADAVWTGAGSWDAEFPVTNVADLVELRRVAALTNTAAASITFTFPSAVLMDFVALVHHNAPADAVMRIRLSSGADPTTNLLHDSGNISVWPAGTYAQTFPPTRPYRLAAPVAVRSGRIDLAAGVQWEIGAVDIGSFWSWTDIGVARGIGVESNAVVADVGVDHVMRQWAPRIFTGARGEVAQSELDGKFVDFQREYGLWKPFTFAWDVDDSATWARECYVATNNSLPPGVVNDVNVGSMTLDFVEYI